MQMREVNKDLKLHFKLLQEKVHSLFEEGTVGEKENRSCTNHPSSFKGKDQLVSQIEELLTAYRLKQNYDNLLTIGGKLPTESETEETPMSQVPRRTSSIGRTDPYNILH